MKAKKQILTLLLIVLIGAFALLVVGMSGGGDIDFTSGAKDALEAQGYTNIDITGISTKCAPEDAFHYAFTATNPATQMQVSGSVCGGGMKGWHTVY
ncbi:MAG: hypothetical protein HN392_11345 [Anaerolineae bacterium]|jgi:hypothetical protein|nr:hypothetical protein [Anaerolineae bacterium]MBT7783463.1 hypothetical protein [Anaerolineae bacterium]